MFAHQYFVLIDTKKIVIIEILPNTDIAYFVSNISDTDYGIKTKINKKRLFSIMKTELIYFISSKPEMKIVKLSILNGMLLSYSYQNTKNMSVNAVDFDLSLDPAMNIGNTFNNKHLVTGYLKILYNNELPADEFYIPIYSAEENHIMHLLTTSDELSNIRQCDIVNKFMYTRELSRESEYILKRVNQDCGDDSKIYGVIYKPIKLENTDELFEINKKIIETYTKYNMIFYSQNIRFYTKKKQILSPYLGVYFESSNLYSHMFTEIFINIEEHEKIAFTKYANTIPKTLYGGKVLYILNADLIMSHILGKSRKNKFINVIKFINL